MWKDDPIFEKDVLIDNPWSTDYSAGEIVSISELYYVFVERIKEEYILTPKQ